MNHYSQKQLGFTLIEIAIVLLIVTILLGYTVAMFPIQQELKQYRQAEVEMNDMRNQLIGFAQINGRLPCPDTSTAPGAIDGVEDQILTGCSAYFAFYPARTLGIDGDYDSLGRLLDPWGQPYLYAVSQSDAASPYGTVGNFDFVVANEIRAVGIENAQPDLVICDDSTAVGNNLNCPAGINTVASNVAAVIVSSGKDKNRALTAADNSTIQIENLDDFHNGTNDKVYIASTRRDANNAEYDDVVKWISTNQLFSKMIEADQLP